MEGQGQIYVMDTDKADIYTRTRLLPSGFGINDIMPLEAILLFPGCLPSQTMGIIRGLNEVPDSVPPGFQNAVSGGKIEVLPVHEYQENPRESIYLCDGKYLVISMPGGRSRWRRYTDMCERWTEECLPNLDKYKGKTVSFIDVPYQGSLAKTNERFGQLDDWLVGILMGDENIALMPNLTPEWRAEIRRMMENTVVVSFGSQTKIHQFLGGRGISRGSIKVFQNEYIDFQFVPLPKEKYMLGIDYTYGRQTGSIIEKLFDVIDMEARSGHWPVDKNGNVDISIVLHGKLGGLAKGMKLGDVVAPTGLFMEGKRMVMPNPIRVYAGNCRGGTVLPIDTVAKQKKINLKKAAESKDADLIEMELRDAFLALNRATLENHRIKSLLNYLGWTSDLPNEGTTLADEFENKHSEDVVMGAIAQFAEDSAILSRR